MPNEQAGEVKGSLERARERLYSPGAVLETPPPSLSREGLVDTPHAWSEAPLPAPVSRGVRHIHLAGIFFAFAAVFFLVSLAIAGYFFYFGGNTVSVNKIDIKVDGPLTVAGGDTVPLTLTISNRNPVALSEATLEVTLPEGSRRADDVLIAYPRHTEKIAEIESGGSVTRSIRAVVFGGEGAVLEFPVTLSYRVPGSSAVFVKRFTYALDLASSPLSVSVEAAPETVSGKPFSTKITIRSNAVVPLENVVARVELPFGFSFISASVPLENNSFALGVMRPGTTREIILTGAILGQDKEERTITVSVGTSRSPADPTPSIVYMTQRATFAIVAPFLRTVLALDGDVGDNPILEPGARHTASVSYTNTLPVSIRGATVQITLSGAGIDYASIETPQGFYRSSDKTIIFSPDTDASLGLLSPGASGIGSFSFATLPAGTVTSPTATFTVSVSGIRAGEEAAPEQIQSSTTKTAKVSTTVVAGASVLRLSGPFQNTGPVPPKVNQATTYTIVLRAETKGNAVAGGTLTTTLPDYVAYTERTSGKGAISFNTTTRTVTWSVGDLAQGEKAEAFFQVSFTPSLSQKGTSPELAGPVNFAAHDRFTNSEVKVLAPAVTTASSREPGYSSASAVVQ